MVITKDFDFVRELISTPTNNIPSYNPFSDRLHNVDQENVQPLIALHNPIATITHYSTLAVM